MTESKPGGNPIGQDQFFIIPTIDTSVDATEAGEKPVADENWARFRSAIDAVTTPYYLGLNTLALIAARNKTDRKANSLDILHNRRVVDVNVTTPVGPQYLSVHSHHSRNAVKVEKAILLLRFAEPPAAPYARIELTGDNNRITCIDATMFYFDNKMNMALHKAKPNRVEDALYGYVNGLTRPIDQNHLITDRARLSVRLDFGLKYSPTLRLYMNPHWGATAEDYLRANDLAEVTYDPKTASFIQQTKSSGDTQAVQPVRQEKYIDSVSAILGLIPLVPARS
jgi:hypothetical protein